MTISWLVDKSALWRLAQSPDAEEWFSRIERGLVRVATVTVLEVGYSARSGDDWTDLVAAPPVSLMPRALATPAAELRCVAVQEMLAARGEHRAPSVPDLLIAAIAEIEGLTVLHRDKDFDLIAGVTGQSAERLRMA